MSQPASPYAEVEGDFDLRDQYAVPTDAECDALYARLDAENAADRAPHDR